MSELTVALDALTEDRRTQAGEKAWNVARLRETGFRSPDGFVLVATARERDHDELREAIAFGLRALPDGPVAVRSSGTAEDLPGASFAGMYETVLGVEGVEAILEAAIHCWRALEGQRLVSYAGRLGLDPAKLSLALLVQPMVEAESAGVLFTVDPTSGDEDHFLIEAAPGLGEAVVSGSVDPVRYVVHRRTGDAIDIVGERAEPVLDSARLSALIDVGRRVQRTFGSPQDIEFAFAADGLFLLQSRPITALSFAERMGEWTTADFRDGGVSASSCTPYMWSLYRYIWGHSMPGYFADLGLLGPGERDLEWGRMFFGRPYWNVGAVKSCVARVPGYVERNFDEDLAIEVKYEGPGRTTPFGPLVVLRALPVLFRLKRLYRQQLELNEAFVSGFEQLEAKYLRSRPQDLDWSKLLDRYRNLIRTDYFEVESNYFRTIYNLSNAKMDLKTVLDSLSRSGLSPDYSALVAGLDDLRTLEPVKDLYRIASRISESDELKALFSTVGVTDLLEAWEAGREQEQSVWRDLDRYVEKFRYHSRVELDITVPRWDEDPEFVMENIRSTFKAFDPERAPNFLHARQRDLYLAERGRVASRLGLLARRGFDAKLENVRRYTWWREEMRDRSTRVYYLIRRETRALAWHLVERGSLSSCEDVWFLPWEDVLELAEGTLSSDEAARRIDEAREYFESYRRFEAPGEIGSRYETSAAIATIGDEWRGTAASPGRTSGRVRVLRSIDQADRLQKGEVLVAPFTDPGWTPLLGVAAAVVTETGGLLSHAAVISREYGIPAVLAIKGITRFVVDGEVLEVDGSSGVVRRLGGVADSGEA